MNYKEIQGFNKSSLISLKAELARKREEVDINPKQNLSHSGLKFKNNVNAKNTDKPENEHLEDLTSEEKDLEKLSRNILASKSKIYDKLCNKELVLDKTDSYLVNFDEKQENKLELNEKCGNYENNYCTKEDLEASTEDAVSENENDWVDYVDNFGRTRKCLRGDLSFYRNADSGLINRTPKNDMIKEEKSKVSEELLSWDMKREALRQKWEEEETLLAQKKNTHYQDILFDEARQHGTGYYQFSKDEEERLHQQESLQNMRKETEQEQENAKLMKQHREMLLKARINAAKKRKRIRLGLPPADENEEEEKDSELHDDKVENVNKEENIDPIKEMNDKILENLEKIHRLTHVRPWDIGKEGVTVLPVMSQEEWNQKKRLERVKEFAPPSLYNEKFTQDSFKLLKDTITDSDNKEESLNKIQFDKQEENTDVFKVTDENLSKTSSSLQCVLDKRSNHLYFTSKRFKSRNSINENIKQQEKTLIDFECLDEGESKINSEIYRKNKKGVQIPPPLSYNNVPDVAKKRNTSKMTDSIEAGLNFLKHEAEINETKREKGFL